MVGRAPLRWSDAQNRSGLVDRDLKSLEGERLVDHSSVVERLENEPMRRWGFDVLDFLQPAHGSRGSACRRSWRRRRGEGPVEVWLCGGRSRWLLPSRGG